MTLVCSCVVVCEVAVCSRLLVLFDEVMCEVILQANFRGFVNSFADERT